MIPREKRLWLMLASIALIAAGIVTAIIYRGTLKEIDYAAIENRQIEVRNMGDTLQEYYEEYGDNFAQADYIFSQSDLVIVGTPSAEYQLLPTSIDRKVKVNQVLKGTTPADMIHVIEPSFIWFYTNGDCSGRAVLGYAPMKPHEPYILFLQQERENVYTITHMAFGKYPIEANHAAEPLDWTTTITYSQVCNNLLLSSDSELFTAYLKAYDEVIEMLNTICTELNLMDCSPKNGQ